MKRLLYGLALMGACMLLASAAIAQETKPQTKSESATIPTLVPGSEVSLAAVKAADWIQGKPPTAFEPDKVYVFECWATWCGPCITLIPHVNQLHKKYYDQGLRVHGISWENDKKLVQEFVRTKGPGMSYPVAVAIKGSAFETEWLTAAGVKSIPHAFVVRNGKLLLATDASRLTDSLIQSILSGDEGAKQAAAKIKAAYDARGAATDLARQIYSARRKNDAVNMATKLNELVTLDSEYYELPGMKLDLLIIRKEWAAAVIAIGQTPASQSKTSFLLTTARKIVNSNAGTYPLDFIKAVAVPYSEYVKQSGTAIGPNHFAYLSIIHWQIGDKDAAASYADQGVEAAISSSRANEFRTNAFKRFAKSVKQGTLPKFKEMLSWQIEAKKKAADKADNTDK